MNRSWSGRAPPPHLAVDSASSLSPAGPSRPSNGVVGPSLPSNEVQNGSADDWKTKGSIATAADKGKLSVPGHGSSRSRTSSNTTSSPRNGHKLAGRPPPSPLNLPYSHTTGDLSSASHEVHSYKSSIGLTISDSIPTSSEPFASTSKVTHTSAHTTSSGLALPQSRDAPVKFSLGGLPPPTSKGKEKDNSQPNSASSARSRFSESGGIKKSNDGAAFDFETAAKRSNGTRARRDTLDLKTLSVDSVDDATAMAALLGEVEEKMAMEEKERKERLRKLETQAAQKDPLSSRAHLPPDVHGSASIDNGLHSFPPVSNKLATLPSRPSRSVTATLLVANSPPLTTTAIIRPATSLTSLPIIPTASLPTNLPQRPNAAIEANKRPTDRARERERERPRSRSRTREQDVRNPPRTRRRSDVSMSDDDDRWNRTRADVPFHARSSRDDVWEDDRDVRSRRRADVGRPSRYDDKRRTSVSPMGRSEDGRDRRRRRDPSSSPPARRRDRREQRSPSPSRDRRSYRDRKDSYVKEDRTDHRSKVSSPTRVRNDCCPSPPPRKANGIPSYSTPIKGEDPVRPPVDDAPPPPSPPPPPPPIADLPEPPYEPEPLVKPAGFSRKVGRGNYRVTYDPATHKPKAGEGTPKGKIVYRYDGVVKSGKEEIKIVDPRTLLDHSTMANGQGSKANQTELLQVPSYSWDEHSFGPKPPPPAGAVCITGLHPLTSSDMVQKYMRSFGKIFDHEMKLDPKTGASLGICWINFWDSAHGEDPIAAHQIAVKAKQRCTGVRIGSSMTAASERVKVFLDRKGEKAEREAKAEVERRKTARQTKANAPPVVVQATATPKLSPSAAAVAVSQGPRSVPPAFQQRPPLGPSAGVIAPRMAQSFARPPVAVQARFGAPFFRSHATLGGFSHLPFHPMNRQLQTMQNTATALGTQHSTGFVQHHHPVPVAPMANPASNFVANPFQHPAGPSNEFSGEAVASRRTGAPNGVSLTHFVGNSLAEDDSASDMEVEDSDDEARREKPARIPPPKARQSILGLSPLEAIRLRSKVENALKLNGHEYLFIDKAACPLTDESKAKLAPLLSIFKHEELLHDGTGWYILFEDAGTAGRAVKMIGVTKVNGRTLNAEKKPPFKEKPIPRAPLKERSGSNVSPAKIAPAPLPSLTPEAKAKPLMRVPRRIDSDDESEGTVAEAPIVAESKDSNVSPTEAETAHDIPSLQAAKALETDVQDLLEAGQVEAKVPFVAVDEALTKAKTGKVTKRKAKAADKQGKPPPKKKQKKQANRVFLDIVSETVETERTNTVTPATILEDSLDVTLSVEDELETEPRTKPTGRPEVTKEAIAVELKPVKQPGPVRDAIAEGLAEDDEDLYLMALAIEKARKADSSLLDNLVEGEPQAEVKHSTGCARTQGYYKVREVDKSSYLPSRNRAAVDVEPAVVNATVTSTSRSTRVATRRLVQGMEQHKKATATDTDVFQFNQLRTRKKHLKFSKSPIHDWGLYAMEAIPQGEMVIEYVGEVIRAQMADIREKYYEKTGIGSSYLFRVDDEAVVDATKKGNLGRLINHCCAPNCTAKIITINGEKKIVIYAKSNIEPGEEITYDYHFPIEQEKIVCLCGSSKCRGYLN